MQKSERVDQGRAHGPDYARLRAWVLLVFAGVVWGLTFSLAKIATESGAHPLGLTFWQAAIGAGLLIVYNLVKSQRLPLDRPHLWFYLACGLMGTVIPSTLYFYAAPNLPAGVLSITITTTPLFTFAAALFFGLEKLAVLRILGVGLGIVAVIMLVAPDTSLPDPGAAPWVLVAVAAALCYVAENMIIALRLPSTTTAGMALTGMLTVAALVLAPVLVVTDTFVPITLSADAVNLSIIGMAIINVVAYGLFVYLVAVAGPVFASQMGYWVTVSGIAWGMVIFNEQHSLWIWGSVMVMFLGLALVQPRGARGKPNHENLETAALDA